MHFFFWPVDRMSILLDQLEERKTVVRMKYKKTNNTSGSSKKTVRTKSKIEKS